MATKKATAVQSVEAGNGAPPVLDEPQLKKLEDFLDSLSDDDGDGDDAGEGADDDEGEDDDGDDGDDGEGGEDGEDGMSVDTNPLDEEDGGAGGPDDPIAEALPPASTPTSMSATMTTQAGPPPKKRGRPPGSTNRAPRNEATLNVAPAPAARGVRGPRSLTDEQRAASPVLNRMRQFQDSAYQEIDGLLGSLNFAEHEYQVRIERVEPDFDEHDQPCSGYLTTYKKTVSLDDIERRYGGGLFMIKIHGPHPTTGRPGFIKQERIRIAGPPKPMSRAKDGEDSRKQSDVAALVEANERTNRQLVAAVERAGQTEGSIEKLVPLVMPLFEKMFARQEQSQQRLLEEQREQRREERERREDERRREEDRRAEERERERERREEERRREDERRREEERQREERREEERERQREEKERLREELRAAEERRKEEREERQRQHEREMAQAAERRREEQENQRRYLELTSNAQKQNTEMLMQTMSFQLESLEKRQTGGGIESLAAQLLTLNNLKNTLTGEGGEPSTIDKITDGLEKIVTTVVPVAQQAWKASQPKGAQGGQSQNQNQGQQAKPLVVDMGPVKPALPQPQQQQGQPQQGQATQNQGGMPPAPPSTEMAGIPTTDPVQDANEIKNELLEFRMPTPEEARELLLAGTLLIQNVDLAVQKEMSAEDIVDKILDPFEEACPMIMSFASSLDAKGLVEFIEQNVPPSWAILTPRGEKLVQEAFELWQDDGDGADEAA